MRPYLMLTAVVLTAVALAPAAFGQQPVPRPYGGCFYYGCGPFIPMVTTPQISLQQFSPNPVGATNATTGLIAGATNSTLSQIQGSTSSVYTVGVWYQGGGAALITPAVNLWPETLGREGRPMREAMREERAPEARPHEVYPRETRSREEHFREEHGPRHAEEARGEWTYFNAPAAAESGFRKAAHTYGNGDVTRQNDKNGAVKYDGKTEKM